MAILKQVQEAADFIAPRLKAAPQVAIILGSGLGDLANRINPSFSIAYPDLPYGMASRMPGHEGRIIFGELAGRQVACLQGRLHCYEGNTPAQTVFPLHVVNQLGATTLVVTNASGGINKDFMVGDIMLINDHINLTGTCPVTLREDAVIRECFDMSYAYDPKLLDLTRTKARELGLALKEGVYIGVRGPQFETPAEIRAFSTMGADAVGMSTVFEVIAARGMGMRVIGLSVVTNMAAGILPVAVTVDEILAASRAATCQLDDLISAMIADL